MAHRFAIPALASILVASSAFAGVVSINLTNNGTLKRLSASYDDGIEKMVTIRVLSKTSASAPWVISTPMTTTAVNAKNVEEPFKPELEMWAAITTDCDTDGIPDSVEISAGAIDFDGDLVPDSCEYRIGDLNLNGVIDQQDVNILLGWWGIANPLYGDLNFDGIVNGTDMGIMLGRFGAVVF